MVWIDVFRGFLSICGLAVTVFVLVQAWKAIHQMLREAGPLTPGQRRENWLAGLGTIGFFLLGAAGIYGAYVWGESEWGARQGAALAIGAFVVVTTLVFLAGAVIAARDARRDREQRSSRR